MCISNNLNAINDLGSWETPEFHGLRATAPFF
jgi:hypothetical protein